MLQRHLSHADDLTCENAALRGQESRSGPQGLDVQIQSPPSTGAVAVPSVRTTGFTARETAERRR